MISELASDNAFYIDNYLGKFELTNHLYLKDIYISFSHPNLKKQTHTSHFNSVAAPLFLFLVKYQIIYAICIIVLYFFLNRQIMNNSATHHQRIAKMTFASVYPMYLAKIEKKGRTKGELNEVIKWLTNFSDEQIENLTAEKATFETFFRQAALNPNAELITGVICGHRIEEIENPLTRQVRYLDKLVDELAKGRKMEKILRGSNENSKTADK